MKASNIFQKLKGAGVGNPDGMASKKPVVKGLGVQSPAKMKSPIKKNGESMTPYSVKDGKGTFHGPKVSYDMAYKNRDKKVYGDMSKAEYIKESKRQTKSFESTGSFDVPKAKKATINKGQKQKPITNSELEKQKTVKVETKKPKAKVDAKVAKKAEPSRKTKSIDKKLAKAEIARAAGNEKKALRKEKRAAKKAARVSKSALAMKKSPAKMKKSPAKKALVGKQENLPDHLKAKIKAAPGKMKKDGGKGKKVKRGGSVSERRAEKLVAKGKGKMVYKVGGIGKDNQPGGKNNKGELMKIKKNSVKIKKIKK